MMRLGTLMRILGTVILVVSLLPKASIAQSADASAGLLVPTRHPVYHLLDRLEILRVIDQVGTSTKPMRRSEVTLALVRANEAELEAGDRALVERFLQEFAPPEPGRLISRSGNRIEHASTGSYASVGGYVRLSSSRWSGGDFTLWRDLGAEGFAKVGSNVFAHGTIHAAAQTGDRIGPPVSNSPEPGLNGWTSEDTTKAYYYDTSEGYLALAWDRGGIWLGRFRDSWGPGIRGQLALSDKPPALPQIMLLLEPWEWLRYRFVHARLESGVLDSTTLRISDVGERFLRYYRKYLVAHRLDFWPDRRLRIGLGQSVIYGAGDFDLAYLVPMGDLLHVQHATGGRDNVQLAADATLFWPRYTAMSAALFVDEFSTSLMFDSQKNRNWIAGQVGFRVADFWGVWRGSTLRVEYTRLNPWVYEHRYPWGTFASAGVGILSRTVQYPLGHWLGQNADDVYIELSYCFPPPVTVTVWGERTRKGQPSTIQTHPYDVRSGYRASPFLSDPKESSERLGVRARWNTWRHVNFEGSVSHEWNDDSLRKSSEWLVELAVQLGNW